MGAHAYQTAAGHHRVLSTLGDAVRALGDAVRASWGRFRGDCGCSDDGEQPQPSWESTIAETHRKMRASLKRLP
jgi:hypothetical protein